MWYGYSMGKLEKFKIEAQNLRRAGKSYGEIQKAIGIKIPKSTLSDWCRGIILPEEHRKRLTALNYTNLRRGRELALRNIREEKDRFLQLLKNRNGRLLKKVNKDVAKLLLAVLYLGEGKKQDGLLVLGSSDPGIIKLFLALLKMCYGITTDRVKCRISYRVDQPIALLTRYWMKIVGIPAESFYKTVPDPRTAGRATKKKDYKGVCVIYILNSTKIHKELEVVANMLMGGL